MVKRIAPRGVRVPLSDIKIFTELVARARSAQ